MRLSIALRKEASALLKKVKPSVERAIESVEEPEGKRSFPPFYLSILLEIIVIFCAL